MSKYLTPMERASAMNTAEAILTAAATPMGMEIARTQDVIRVRDAGQTILSFYSPNYYGQARWTVEGKFVPVQSGRKYRNRRSFWRSDATKAATEALQYIRRQNPVEALFAERDAVMRASSDRPYRGAVPEYRYTSTGEVQAFALAAYEAGYRTGDDSVDATMEHALRVREVSLSDNLWSWLLFTSFAPALDKLVP